VSIQHPGVTALGTRPRYGDLICIDAGSACSGAVQGAEQILGLEVDVHETSRSQAGTQLPAWLLGAVRRESAPPLTRRSCISGTLRRILEPVNSL
jgi:hypothetical protein